MADQDEPFAFERLPLEVRHIIFRHAAVRDIQAKYVLRCWFEKQDVTQQVAKIAANHSAGPAPRIARHVDVYEVDSDVTDEDENYGDDEEMEEDDDADDDENEEDDDVDDEENEEDDGNEDEEDDGYGAEYANEDEQEDISHDGGVTNTTTAAVAPVQAPRPVIRPHPKWRHIPNFMRLSQYPPAVNLLLVSKHLKADIMKWFWDVTTLRIEATGSFAHTSFFEEAFSQITDAAFSPMKNVRKVEVTFVWDTTWIRADTTGCVEAIFPALLRQRAEFIVKILQRAPDLKNLTVYWHDSAQDAESIDLRTEIYHRFLGLPATIEFKERYIAANATPERKSIAGQGRVAFQDILDNGLHRLF